MCKEQRETKRKRVGQAIRELWQWSKTRHLSIFGICILSMIGTCGSLVIAAATRGLIDSAVGRDGRQFLFNAILISGAVLTIRLCGLISGLLSAKTGAELLRDLRTMVLRRLLHKQYAELDGFHSGELVNRMFSDVGIVRNGIMEAVPAIVSMAVGFAGAAVLLIRMDWRFILLMLAGGLLGLILIAAFHKPMTSRHKAAQESEGRLHAALQELLENLRLVKASGTEKRMEGRTEDRQQAFLAAQLRKGRFSVSMNNSISLVFQLSWLFCMLWGCYGIYCGRLTYGMLAAILQLLGQIQGPFSKAAGVADQLYGTISSAERLKELLDLPEEEPVPADDSVPDREFREIRLCGVDFSYGRRAEPVLKQVNLTIRAGEFAAVTGASGSGKSTLLQLLLGIYQPVGGELKFCFADGKEMAVSRSTRGLFAYVPQGNTLFSGTLRENLTMFTDSASDEEILQAARLACLDRFLAELSDGLDTVIGERGIGLSEGQAQRVAVARALLSRAPILLLDECTSALDEKTETELLRNIASLRGKTCLIVTHRRAALEICNSRIHIGAGKVEKIGGFVHNRGWTSPPEGPKCCS